MMYPYFGYDYYYMGYGYYYSYMPEYTLMSDLPSHCMSPFMDFMYYMNYYYDSSYFGYAGYSGYGGYSYGSYSGMRRKLQAIPKRQKVSNHARPGLRHRDLEVVETKPRVLFRLEQTARRLNGGSDHEKDLFRERQRRLMGSYYMGMYYYYGGSFDLHEDESFALNADEFSKMIDKMSTMEAMGTCPDMYKNATMDWACCNMFGEFPEEMMRMVEIGANRASWLPRRGTRVLRT